MYARLKDNIITKYPINIDDLREEYPSISFPSSFNQFDYSEYDIIEYVDSEFPEYNPEVERIVEGTPLLEGDTWKQNWVTEPLSEEEKQKILDDKIFSIRAQRNLKLTESDWTQSNDSPLSDESKLAWAQYRQELRDITSQEGYPHNVTWPEQP